MSTPSGCLADINRLSPSSIRKIAAGVKRNEGKIEVLVMPRTQRLKINDETAVYHAWDAEPNPPATLRFD